MELHLKILSKLDYVFDHQVLSTQDFAIPQSRPRVYILAVAKEICAGTVKLPEKRSEKVDLHHFIQKDKTGSEVLQLPRYEELLGSKMWRKGYSRRRIFGKISSSDDKLRTVLDAHALGTRRILYPKTEAALAA